MTKLNIVDVRKVREENTPALFNMAMAMQAIKDTPAKVSKGTNSDLTKNIMALFDNTPTLACNQVKAALCAGGMEVTSKQVADRLWLMAKQGKLAKGETKGVYVKA